MTLSKKSGSHGRSRVFLFLVCLETELGSAKKPLTCCVDTYSFTFTHLLCCAGPGCSAGGAWGRSHPSGALTTDLPPDGSHEPHGQRKGEQCCSCAPSLTIPAAPPGLIQNTMPEDPKGRDVMLMAGVKVLPAQDPIPAAAASELSAARCTHLGHGIQHPLQTPPLRLPSQLSFCCRSRWKGTGCKSKTVPAAFENADKHQ